MPHQPATTDRAGFAKSAAYDQNRPSYTATAVENLLQEVRVAGHTHAKILDLGAGTGIFTAVLADRDEQYEIIAVEPHHDMRKVLDERKLRNATVLEGKADGIPLEDESVDAVICAQVNNIRVPSSFGRSM